LSRLIYFVTHGQKEIRPNPGLTPLGKKQISQLKGFLPNNIGSVICGVGRCYLQTASLLGLEPTFFSSIVGGAETENRENKKIILADGTEIDSEKYLMSVDQKQVFLELLKVLSSQTLIVTGRTLINRLKGGDDATVASLYSYRPETCRWQLIKVVPPQLAPAIKPESKKEIEV
jgi:hypothetical protein